MPYHRTLHETEIVLDTEAQAPAAIVRAAIAHLAARGKLCGARRQSAEDALEMLEPTLGGPADLGHGVGVLRVRDGALAESLSTLMRPIEPLEASDGAVVRFVWVVLGTGGDDEPSDDALGSFGWMLADDRFTAEALGASSVEDLVEVYERYLAYVESPAPSRAHVPDDELRRVGGIFGGVLADARRRYPQFATDVRDGLHPKALASILFIFFACLAPAVAFGGLLSVLTEGSIGVIECIVVTAIGGVVYALLSAQPLTIIGMAGPVVIFMGMLYELCRDFSVPYMPAVAWVGMWTGAFLVLVAATEASIVSRFFTRFTHDIFAAIIAIIYLVEAGRDILRVTNDPSVPRDSASLSLLLAFGTFAVAMELAGLRRSPALRRPIREFLADFGPTIAIVTGTAVAIYMRPIPLDTLDVPSELATSTGRAWLVNPFEAPPWVWLCSAGPALLLTTLLFLNHSITTRLVNDPQHSLEKGAGYNLDLLLLGILVAGGSLFGLPYVVGAVVRSLNHVRSLSETETHGGTEQIAGVRENRVTGLAVHLLIGASLLFLVHLRQLPMAVLFGVFLFMGFSSLRGNQMFERLRLAVTDVSVYPPTHYLRRVPTGVTHAFTAMQAGCLVLLWAVKVSPIGILFPLFIALLVPVRLALGRLFQPKHLAFLDAEEEPYEEADRDLV